MPRPPLSHFLVPLLACAAGAAAGKWISHQPAIFAALASRAGRLADLALGADNPSLILGGLGLLLGFLLVWRRGPRPESAPPGE